ncbi:MarR family transcriptional regulator [Streptomyces sp. NPDC006632]|uniref:MarR family transcriptional regulator n=1 Tax=unclassified Streptomyces TaxID=2593676 RepID=UPI002E238463
MAAEKPERLLVEEWRDILATHARTTCELDRELHAYGLCASDFEVLDMLAELREDESACGLRVQELASRIHLSQSALSRLIGRLEKDGLVVRRMCREDRRGVSVSITEAGRSRHTEVLPLQRAVLARMLTARPEA